MPQLVPAGVRLPLPKRIQPDQAWATAFLGIDFNNLVFETVITWPNLGITAIDIGWFMGLINTVQAVNGSVIPTVDLSGNAMPQALVDALLSAFNGMGQFGGTLNMSGGTNAGLDTLPHIDGIVDFFPGGPSAPALSGIVSGFMSVGTGQFGTNARWENDIVIDDTINFADSTADPGDISSGIQATITIGIADNPTKIDVVTKILSLWSAASFLGSPALVSPANPGIRVTYTQDGDLTVSAGSDHGDWVNNGSQGQVLQENPDWVNLTSVLGWNIPMN